MNQNKQEALFMHKYKLQDRQIMKMKKLEEI